MESFSTQEEQNERASTAPDQGVEAFRLSSTRERPTKRPSPAPDKSTPYLKAFLRKGNKDRPPPAPDEILTLRASSGKSITSFQATVAAVYLTCIVGKGLLSPLPD